MAERERTLARIEEKQARLSNFLQQTKSRVLHSEDTVRAVARAETRVIQQETRRRLDQGSSLIPKPTAAARRDERPGSKGWRRVAGVKSARDVAAELGHEVFSELSETMVRPLMNPPPLPPLSLLPLSLPLSLYFLFLSFPLSLPLSFTPPRSIPRPLSLCFPPPLTTCQIP